MCVKQVMEMCLNGVFMTRHACYKLLIILVALLSSNLLPRKLKIKIYKTIILPLFCMGVKLGR
jgi:hypothetical protein